MIVKPGWRAAGGKRSLLDLKLGEKRGGRQQQVRVSGKVTCRPSKSMDPTMLHLFLFHSITVLCFHRIIYASRMSWIHQPDYTWDARFQEKSMWFILNEQLSRVSSKLVSIVKKKSGQIVFDETHERNAGKLPVVPFLRNCGSNAKDET